MTQTPGQEAAATVPARPTVNTAVLYVCAERGVLTPGLAAERAEVEGRAYAAEHRLAILDVLQDEFGEPDPCNRAGWKQVRPVARAAR
ncbi:hypothetical protein [Streptomyces sp. NPDC091215]|uniref:hypothetical protein n=1 Tax=Streptomyces sp. NPDC091215 TaxID=3155192 RepID=UPI0034293B65